MHNKTVKELIWTKFSWLKMSIIEIICINIYFMNMIRSKLVVNIIIALTFKRPLDVSITSTYIFPIGFM